LHASRLLRRVPSVATIKRILHEAGVYRRVREPRPPYFPQPRPSATYVVQASDWTARYLAGGRKVFAFHTVDLQTQALSQTISADKSVATALAHALHSWRQLGLPDGLQLDNDAAFCGGYKKARVFGRFVRLCLYCGVEPIFLPPGEPRRNGVVERLNGLWAQACWQRRRFRSPAEAARASAEFTRWHTHEYRPPSLHGLTPAQAQRRAARRRLTAGEVRALPEVLPLTAGRVHFLRRVDEEGRITLLNETWAVGRRLRGQYVWATVLTHERRLEVYHRRAASAPARLVKVFRYRVHETVTPLRATFKRRQRRRKVSTMS
jgi:putative transposase